MAISPDFNKLYASSLDGNPVGVTLGEIALCLGADSEELGQLCGDKMVQNGSLVDADRTNPWAKYKPVSSFEYGWINRDAASATLSMLGFKNILSLTNNNTPPAATTIAQLLTCYADTATLFGVPANGWRYNKPTGIVGTSTFRVWDFLKVGNGGVLNRTASYDENGYDHTAENPFGTFIMSAVTYARNGGKLGARQDVGVVPQGGASNAHIVVTDINTMLDGTALKYSYYGLLLVPVDLNGDWDTTYAAKLVVNNEIRPTPSSSLVDDTIYRELEYRGEEDMHLTQYALTAGEFSQQGYNRLMVYPFITNVKFTNSRLVSIPYSSRTDRNIINGANLYPIPGATPALITLYDFEIEIEITASNAVSGSGGTYTTAVSFTIKNNYNYAITIAPTAGDPDSGLMIKVRGGGKAYTDTRATGEVFWNALFKQSDAGTNPDSTYSGTLGSITIAAGATYSSLDFQVTLPSSEINNIFIGCYYGGRNQYSNVTPRMPVTPNLQTL